MNKGTAHICSHTDWGCCYNCDNPRAQVEPIENRKRTLKSHRGGYDKRVTPILTRQEQYVQQVTIE